MERDPAKKKAKRRRGNHNAGKRDHLLNIFQYAVENFSTLSSERDQMKLRCFAIALHCPPHGVRLRERPSAREQPQQPPLIALKEIIIIIFIQVDARGGGCAEPGRGGGRGAGGEALQAPQ